MFGESDGVMMLVSWFTFTFPYANFDREVAMIPYMTRDFIAMKEKEKLKAKGFA